MADVKITESELAKNLMGVLARIEQGNETFVVERNGIDVAVLRPVDKKDVLSARQGNR